MPSVAAAPSPSPAYYGDAPPGDGRQPDIQPIGDEENLARMVARRSFVGVHPDTIMWSQFRQPAVTDADLELHRQATCANCMAWILGKDPTTTPPRSSSGFMTSVYLADYCQTILSQVNIFGGVGRFDCHDDDFDPAQYRSVYDPARRVYEIRPPPPTPAHDDTRPLMMLRRVHPGPGLARSRTSEGLRQQVVRATADGRRQAGRLAQWAGGVEAGLVKQLEAGAGARVVGKKANLLRARLVAFDGLPAWAWARE
ncbi:MAG: hypothetical protein M1826_003860 [Phylliscum demangeonii]|nr:MAG: hypothetical protein M1826_003860 [Phylliscum demangeonii]